MSKKILVTDSLFIFDEHVKKLEAAGYEVERLDKPEATEEEICKAIKGKVGYILGGTERVTEKVIDAADELRVIAFTGSGGDAFIPAWDYATSKGIAITRALHGPTQPVAEWAITAALIMNRGFLDLGRTGEAKFITTPGLANQSIGLIGFGRVGQRIAKMLELFNPQQIKFYSPHEHREEAMALNAELASMDDVLETSDVVFLCVAEKAGENFITKNELAKMKDESLLVSVVHKGIVNEDDLLVELQAGRLRAISDYSADDRFNKLPLGTWFCFNGSNAFNTKNALKNTSDMTVDSLLNMLEKGDDQYLANPEYKK